MFINQHRSLHLIVHPHNAYAYSKHNENALTAAYGLTNLGLQLRGAGVGTVCALLLEQGIDAPLDPFDHYGGIFEKLSERPFISAFLTGTSASVMDYRSIENTINRELYDTVIVTGYNRKMCAGETALALRKLGFQVLMPLDCCEDAWPQINNPRDITEQQLKDAGVILTSAQNVMRMFNAHKPSWELTT